MRTIASQILPQIRQARIRAMLVNQSHQADATVALAAMAFDLEQVELALLFGQVMEPRLFIREGSVVVAAIPAAVHEALGVVARRYAAQLNNFSGRTIRAVGHNKVHE